MLVLRRLEWCAKRIFFKTCNSQLPMAGRVRLCTRLKEHERSQAKTHRKSTNAKTHRFYLGKAAPALPTCDDEGGFAGGRNHDDGTAAAPVRYWCGTGTALVRHWCETGAKLVRIACGTAAERLRNGCGTPADRRRGVLSVVSGGSPVSATANGSMRARRTMLMMN